MNTSDLFETIGNALALARRDSVTANSAWFTDAQAALATLRQRVAAMQAAIDEWDRVANDEVSPMEDAIMACGTLESLTTRMNNGT